MSPNTLKFLYIAPRKYAVKWDLSNLSATCIQIFAMPLTRIGVSLANCIRVAEPRTGNAQTSALRLLNTAFYWGSQTS
jgi:hypothetical protein